MKSRAIIFLPMFCVLASNVLAASETKNFQGLENLIGTWRIEKAASEREKTFQLMYRLISQSSALVEVYENPAKQTTETIFHHDGKNLIATHYCALGNQPRLKATKVTQNNNLEFIFY